jgi:hypothetical protein
MRVRLLIAVLVAVVVSFVAVGAATALPLTQSQPIQAVCKAQGGTFVGIGSSFVVCFKQGGSDSNFTPTQIAVQQTLCERVYGGSFFVMTLPNDPGAGFTFAAECSTA